MYVHTTNDSNWLETNSEKLPLDTYIFCLETRIFLGITLWNLKTFFRTKTLIFKSTMLLYYPFQGKKNRTIDIKQRRANLIWSLKFAIFFRTIIIKIAYVSYMTHCECEKNPKKRWKGRTINLFYMTLLYPHLTLNPH